jgi:hypothetical protein
MTDNDKELLEFAAKAAGIAVEFYETHGRTVCKKVNDYGPNNKWNPLEDDGDAFRLYVQCSMHVNVYYTNTKVSADGVLICKMHEIDSYAATRRAIVLAAAEIGKSI